MGALNLFLAIAIAGIGAQLIKMLIFAFKHKSLSIKDLVVTGGMPSSHSAVVSALLFGILFNEGFSAAFFIALVLAGIVIRDALGVRRSVGELGTITEKIMKKEHIKAQAHFALGHKPSEVLVGVLWGVVSAVLIGLVI